MSRKQYDTKAIQVARIVDEVCLSGTYVLGTSFLRNFCFEGNLQSGVGKKVAGVHAIYSNPASEHLATGMFYLARGDAIRFEARSPQGQFEFKRRH
jgi:hypothetical protein